MFISDKSLRMQAVNQWRMKVNVASFVCFCARTRWVFLVFAKAADGKYQNIVFIPSEIFQPMR